MNTSVNELLSNPAFRPLVLLDEHVTSLRPGEHFYQLVVPCAGMALIIAGPNGWACFGTRILIAAALQ